MPTVTLRPNGLLEVYHGSYWSTSGGSYEGVLGDNTDGSWAHCFVSAGAPGGQFVRCAVSTMTFGPLTQIRSVQIFGRGLAWEASGNQFNYLGVESRTGGAISSTSGIQSTGWSQIQQHSGNVATTNPWGAAWNQTDIDNLEAWAWPASPSGQTTAGVRVYDLWINVVYNDPPAVAVTGPSGIITSLTPTITFTYSDPEGDAKERHVVKVFKMPAAGWGSLVPETNTVDRVYDSGAVVTSGLTQVVGSGLQRGVVYRAYVKVADTGSGSRYGHWAPGSDFKAELSGWGGISR